MALTWEIGQHDFQSKGIPHVLGHELLEDLPRAHPEPRVRLRDGDLFAMARVIGSKYGPLI